LHVCVVYRPKKNKLTTSMFFEEFTPFLHDRSLSAGDFIMVGDTNFHLDKSTDHDVNKFLTLLDIFNFKQHVASFTHRSGHILDVVITKNNQNIVQDTIVGDMISDHNIIVCKVLHPKPKPIRVSVTTRKCRDVDMSAVKADISAKLSVDANVSSASELTTVYNETLTSVLDKHAPVRKKMVTIRASQPWFADEIHKAKRAKRAAERRWRNTGLTVHKEIYLNARTHYNGLLDAAKTSYYHDKITQSGRDMKAIHGVMNDILQRTKELKLPTHTSSSALANDFASFFKCKIDKIRAQLPDVMDSVVFPLPPCTSSWTRFDPVTDEEIHRIIAKSPTKGCSLDPMPTWMVKGATDEIVASIRDIVNASMSTGTVPKSLKTAIISPLLKKPSLDPEVMSNYRPVSNLPFLSKLLEKAVASRLNKYMNTHSLHDPLQSAYKAGHSTETALTKVQNDLLMSMDKHGVAILILLDLSAAFDTIDKAILLDRMKTLLGIGGVVLEWFSSYLSDRTQSVKILQATSVIMELLFGVPQGSVLGPLLFLIYILPLHHLIKSHGLNMHGYADDTQIYLSLTRPDDPVYVKDQCGRVEECLSQIHTWMSANKLKLNSGKTEIILFGTKQKLKLVDIPSLSVAGTNVIVSDKPIRNLGAMFDSSLSMAAQVNNMVKTANFHLRNIGTVRKHLTEPTTKQLVQSLVISRLDYCNNLLCGVTSELLSRLQVVQNKAARLITRTRCREHITPVLFNLHWLPVDARIDFKTMVMVYKALHGEAPGYLRYLLDIYIPHRTLRSADKELLVVPRTKLRTVGDRAFCVHAPKMWNGLPQHVKSCASLPSFRTALNGAVTLVRMRETCELRMKIHKIIFIHTKSP